MNIPDKMNAVITADIVEYSKLSKPEADRLLKDLHELFESLDEVRTNLNSTFSIKRGDSVQVEIDKPEEALVIALLLKTRVNMMAPGNSTSKKPEVDVRIAIGIGTINARRDRVNESAGEAYYSSGRTLDQMKNSKRFIAVITGDPGTDSELETEMKLLEVIMSGWKRTSAEVVYWKLWDRDENQIAAELKISQPAVNQRKKTAGWHGIDSLLQRYYELIRQLR